VYVSHERFGHLIIVSMDGERTQGEGKYANIYIDNGIAVPCMDSGSDLRFFLNVSKQPHHNLWKKQKFRHEDPSFLRECCVGCFFGSQDMDSKNVVWTVVRKERCPSFLLEFDD
jgi:hypothetical protein